MTAHQLVDLSIIDPTIPLDIRYATTNNFLGFAVYSSPKCYLHIDTAQAICRVQKDLKKQNLSLKVFDGYRPLPVQQLMWDTIQDERFIANPAKNKGRHTRGTAVDVTLIDLAGNELEMPSAFDEFTERAHSEFAGASPLATHNRALLKTVMAAHGLDQVIREWWHFDLSGWHDDERYPPLSLPFEALINQG